MSAAFIHTALPLSSTHARTHLLSVRHAPTVPTARRARAAPLQPAMVLGNTERANHIVEGPFDGQFGQWNVTQADVDGVFIYRSALAVMALSVASSVTLALTNSEPPPVAYDTLYFLATAAFGVALSTIHIYLKPLHNFLKVTWGLGAAASLVLAASPLVSQGVVLDTYAKPALLLAIGWQFVALTGLFVKEAFCFGRIEALSLIALIPVLTGGHFLGIIPESYERVGAVAFAALFIFFAIRKFTQPARDDLGDMSVFQHLAKGGEL